MRAIIYVLVVAAVIWAGVAAKQSATVAIEQKQAQQQQILAAVK